MAVYDRSPNPRTPNLWLRYAVSRELAARWGLASRTVREPAGTGDKRAAAALLAQRRREVADGTWRPRTAGRGQTAREYGEQWLAGRERAGLRTVDRERQRLRDYAWPVIGDRLLGDVRRAHILDVVTRAARHVSTRTGRPLAPRTGHGASCSGGCRMGARPRFSTRTRRPSGRRSASRWRACASRCARRSWSGCEGGSGDADE